MKKFTFIYLDMEFRIKVEETAATPLVLNEPAFLISITADLPDERLTPIDGYTPLEQYFYERNIYPPNTIPVSEFRKVGAIIKI